MRPEGCAPTGLKYRRSAIDQARVAGGEILKDALDLQLGPAVGVGRAERMGLVDRQVVRIAVDGGAGREHEAPALRVPQRAEQRERARDVVVEIRERLGDGGADRLQPGEMDHRLRREVVHDVPHGRAVADVGAREPEVAVRQLLDPRQALGARVAEIVDDMRLMARVQRLDERMPADISGPARDQDAHRRLPSPRARHAPCFAGGYAPDPPDLSRRSWLGDDPAHAGRPVEASPGHGRHEVEAIRADAGPIMRRSSGETRRLPLGPPALSRRSNALDPAPWRAPRAMPSGSATWNMDVPAGLTT